MKRFIEAAMKRSPLILTFLVLLLIWGGWSAVRMHRDYLPPINQSVLMIGIRAPHYEARQIKNQIADPMEKALRQVDGLQTIESNSFNGGLFMSLYFPVGTHMNRAERRVEKAVSGVHLPSEVKDPVVTRVSTHSFPVITLCLTSDSSQVTSDQLRTTVQEKVASQLNAIPGVRKVKAFGAGKQGFVITVQKANLKRAGLTMSDIRKALSSLSTKMPKGKISYQRISIPVTVAEQEIGVEDLQQMPVSGTNKKTVPLGSVATVKKEVVRLNTISRTDGRPSVVLNVLKTPSANITSVSQHVKERIRQIPEIQSGKVKIHILSDRGDKIDHSIRELLKEGILGVLFSMICVFLFFRNIRSTALIALSLPVCLLAATGFLKMLGVSLNILTVSGLIVAMGRVVDDSVVILDNMYEKVKQSGGELNLVHLSRAVKEMIPAIVSSTSTTIAVYLPISLVGGMVGKAFAGFSWTVVIALVFSLLFSVLVVPVLALIFWKWLPIRSVDTVEPFVHRMLQEELRHRKKIAGGLVVLLVLAAFAAASLPINFLPRSNSGQVSIKVALPDDSTLNAVNASVQEVEAVLKSNPAVQSFSSSLGTSFTPQFDDVFDAGGGWIQKKNIANLTVKINSGVDTQKFITDLRKRLGTLSTHAVYTVAGQRLSGDDSKFEIRLTGRDGQTLRETAQFIRGKLEMIPGLRVQGEVDGADRPNAYRIVINREKVKKAGLTMENVVGRLNHLLTGKIKTEVKAGTQSVPILIRSNQTNTFQVKGGAKYPDPKKALLLQLGRVTFKAKNGQNIRLAELASLKVNKQSVIRERDGKPFAVVSGDILTRDVGETSGQIKTTLNHLKLPQGVHYSFGGVTKQVKKMIAEMALSLALSILLVLMVLGFVFRGWKAPLSVFLCIPFALIGSIAGLFIFGRTWNLPALVGLLMLVGIVVTNGIVLVDKIERNVKDGMMLRRAVLEGTRRRVRPVLVTAAATIFTLLPLAFSDSKNTIVSESLGLVIVCGMITATLSTLLVVPMVYEWLHRKKGISLSNHEALKNIMSVR